MENPLLIAGRAGRQVLLAALARVISGADDARLERQFGSFAVQRVLLEGMVRSFQPEAAEGFEGVIVYSLTRSATGREPTDWTVEVRRARASVRPGAGPDADGHGAPALRMVIGVADFVRIAAGVIDPAEPLLQSRATFSGDFGLAARMAEMFGAPRLG